MIWLIGLIEAAASLLALYSMGVLLINKVGTTVTFFGETPTVTSENVSSYQRWLATLAVAIALTFGAALWCKGPAGRSLYWQGLVLLAGVLSAVAFHVALKSQTPDPDPVQDRSAPFVIRAGTTENALVGDVPSKGPGPPLSWPIGHQTSGLASTKVPRGV